MVWCVNGIKLSLLLLRPSCFCWGLSFFIMRHLKHQENLHWIFIRHPNSINIFRIITELSRWGQQSELQTSVLPGAFFPPLEECTGQVFQTAPPSPGHHLSCSAALTDPTGDRDRRPAPAEEPALLTCRTANGGLQSPTWPLACEIGL